MAEEREGIPAPGRRAPYTPPAIIHSEKIEARAVQCVKTPGNCVPGPAQS